MTIPIPIPFSNGSLTGIWRFFEGRQAEQKVELGNNRLWERKDSKLSSIPISTSIDWPEFSFSEIRSGKHD